MTDLVVVDAFTAEPFRGNQAAICLLDGPADPVWMQRVAAEMNLSETAFLHPLDDGTRSLRWFTPTVEVELCGHATLASAHVLFTDGHAGPDEVLRFTTRSGVLTASLVGGRVELDFPRFGWELDDERVRIAAALRIDPSLILATATGGGNHLAEVPDPATVVGLQPAFALVADLPLGGVIVTAMGPGGATGPDTVSRYFASAHGIDEDPVTGSAHCLIGPWFAARLGPELRCHQASARGGDLHVTVGQERVRLAGDAVITLRASLLV